MGMEYRKLDLTVTDDNITEDAKKLLNMLGLHWDKKKIIIKVRMQEFIFR